MWGSLVVSWFVNLMNIGISTIKPVIGGTNLANYGAPPCNYGKSMKIISLPEGMHPQLFLLARETENDQ